MIKTVLTAVALLILSGCASIVSNSSYPVSVNSTPTGASFTVTNRSGQQVVNGTTPEVVTLKAGSGYFKKESYTVTVSMDGYEEKTFTVAGSMDGWYWGNIAIGGLIGMLIVDPLTGAMFRLPDSVDVPLSDATVASDLTITTTDTLTPEQIMQLEPIQQD